MANWIQVRLQLRFQKQLLLGQPISEARAMLRSWRLEMSGLTAIQWLVFAWLLWSLLVSLLSYYDWDCQRYEILSMFVLVVLLNYSVFVIVAAIFQLFFMNVQSRGDLFSKRSVFGSVIRANTTSTEPSFVCRSTLAAAGGPALPKAFPQK